MKPRLLRSDATKFDTLGFGALNSTISCIVKEELGVAPTLEMSILMDDPNFVNIEVGNIITALPNKRDQIQAFVIEDITKPINGVVTIYATHIAQHRGKLIPVQPFTASDLDDAFYEIKTNSLEANPFTLVRDPGKANVTATMHPTAPHSFRELLGGVEGSILDTYRGEWGYDNFTITLYNKRGHDNGARVMYGRNMSDFHLEEQFNWDDSVTGVFGYWLGENGDITLSNIQYSQYADLYPYHKTVCVDFSDKFETQPSTLELDTYALSWINGKGLVGASVDVAYEHVNVEGGADVGIGDIVHIYNGVYDFEMESRIVGLEFDVLSEEYINVSIGDMKTTLNEAISDINGGSMGGGGSSVEPSTTTPKMDGTAAIGTEQKYARGDHRHPTDTSRVATAGDTMTGDLLIKSSNLDPSVTPSSAVYGNARVRLTDKNGTRIASYGAYRTAASAMGLALTAANPNTSNINSLEMRVYDDGTREVGVNEAAPWRHAFGPAVGDVICTSTNTNPSSNYGGTWTLIDKEFTPESGTLASASVTKTNVSAATVVYRKYGHTVFLRISFTSSTAMTDTTVNLMTISPAACGVSQFSPGVSCFTALSDDGDALVAYQLQTDGRLQSLDCWKIQSNPAHTYTGAITNFLVPIPITNISYMNDSACNKFYWKRTA